MTVGASRMIGHPLFSIPLCPQPFEGLHPTLIVSIMIYCLTISFSVCLSFSLLELCPVGSSLQVLLILPIPSQYAFSHSGDKVFIRPNSMNDNVPHFSIRNMIPVGDAYMPWEASHFCSVYPPL